MDFNKLFKVETNEQASRKVRKVIACFFAVAAAVMYMLLFKSMLSNGFVLINYLDSNEATQGLIALYLHDFRNQMILYMILGGLIIGCAVYLIISVFSEVFIFLVKQSKIYIYGKNNKIIKVLEKATVGKTFVMVLCLSVLFMIYVFSQLSSGDLKLDSDSYFFPPEIINAFIVLALIMTGTEMLIRNLAVKNMSFEGKEKVVERLLKFDLLKIVAFMLMLTFVLNVIFPSFMKGLNYSVDLLYTNLREPFDVFKTNYLKLMPDVKQEYLQFFEQEVINKIQTLRFKSIHTQVVLASPLMRYTIAAAGAMIIFIPKLAYWGRKKSLIFIALLIVMSLISEFFTKFLYLNEENNIFIYLICYFILVFVLNEFSDFIKEETVPKE